MTPESFNQRLDAYAKQPIPPVPPGFAAGVWREIDVRHHESFVSRVGWYEFLARPAWAIAGLAVACVVGAAPALVFAKAQEAKRLAQESLRLEAFSTQVVTPLSPPEQAKLSSL